MPARTFANLQVVGDEKHLLPTYMPPGGCTCQSMAVDPSCPRCFPAEVLCQPCGERLYRPAARVHNHAPYRPTCNERDVDGQLRGACLNDDGSDR